MDNYWKLANRGTNRIYSKPKTPKNGRGMSFFGTRLTKSDYLSPYYYIN